MAIELGTPSINSANSDERTSTESVLLHESKIVKNSLNPQLKYTNMRDHGFMVLTLKEDQRTAQWYYVESILEPNGNYQIGKALLFNRGEQRLILE